MRFCALGRFVFEYFPMIVFLNTGMSLVKGHCLGLVGIRRKSVTVDRGHNQCISRSKIISIAIADPKNHTYKFTDIYLVRIQHNR
jgi:hypothetical protein